MSNEINKSVVKLLVERDKFEELYNEAKEALQEIKQRMYAIGAPLNDNNLKFNKDQLRWLVKIANICNTII